MDPSVQQFLEEKLQSSIMRSQQSMLDNLDSLMKTRLDEFRKESLSERQRNDELNAESMKSREDTFKFKKRGNEEQAKVNNKVIKKLKEAKIHLASGTDNSVAKAYLQITEGLDLLSHRQKLIKLADSSELGWKIVDEYETHQLASDSEDEKRIYKAELRANRKSKQQQAAKRNRRFTPYSTATSSVPSATVSTQQGGRKPGLCFICGRPGHWKSECDRKTGKGSDLDVPKISIGSDNTLLNSLGVENTSEVSVGMGTDAGCDECITQPFSSEGSLYSEVPLLGELGCGVHELSECAPCVISPMGRLRNHYEKWEQAGASDHILTLVKDGYRLPFLTQPLPCVLRNNKSARENPSFVLAEINKLLQFGCISAVSEAPEVVNPLTVACNRSGKKRLVLDCRHINTCLATFKFRLEDGSVARQMFSCGDFLFTFDLKSAYHHLEIFPAFRKFLGFAWADHGVDRYYVFNVLPFGLSTAAFVFTKLTRVLVKFWRSQGHRVIMYLDDGLGGAHGYEAAVDFSHDVQSDLLGFGFLLATDKCHWDPALHRLWLGLEWDLAHGRVYVSPERVRRLIVSADALEHCLSRRNMMVKARTLAAFLGQILSMHGAIGPVVRLRTRYLYSCLAYKASWDSVVLVGQDALHELLFWRSNVEKLNGQDLVGPACTGSVYTDASGVGFGGYAEGVSGSEVSGAWSDMELILCSTWRELEALNRVCRSIVPHLPGLKRVVDERIQSSGLEQTARVHELSRRMSDILLQSRADSTSIKYYHSFTKWQSFILDLGGEALPAEPIHVALYSTHLIDSGCSHGVVSSAKYAIKWMHDLFDFSDPTSNSFVSNLIHSAKRISAKPVTKKEPVSAQDLIALCRKYLGTRDLLVLRDLSLIILGYAGFFRFDELVSLQANDIHFHERYFTVKIRKSKTDQYRLGDEILIAKGESIACPYQMLHTYMSEAGLTTSSDMFLFRPVFRSGKICKLITKNKGLSYTRTRECILSRLGEVSSCSNLGTHSLRAGGATAAASSGISDRCWKRHGRWRSESAKDGYVKDSLEARLQVSQALGL